MGGDALQNPQEALLKEPLSALGTSKLVGEGGCTATCLIAAPPPPQTDAEDY